MEKNEMLSIEEQHKEDSQTEVPLQEEPAEEDSLKEVSFQEDLPLEKLKEEEHLREQKNEGGTSEQNSSSLLSLKILKSEVTPPIRKDFNKYKPKSIFIGNINFAADIDAIKRLCALPGPYKKLKLNYNSETNKFTGSAFCEYIDADIASSAIRNLNGYEFLGRKLATGYTKNSKDFDKIKKWEMESLEAWDISNPAQEQLLKGFRKYLGGEEDLSEFMKSYRQLYKNMSIQQKENLLDSIKGVVLKSEEHENAIEYILDKHPDLCEILLEIEDDVIESYKNNSNS
ncbi:unnamed protein product [Moneuplotes crassus]|uniref:RRM domain-containing protein n=1 Tax=Euplotes crassus TaxID=5936 RepID=A0AAD1XQK9_EUPCR|nr:unnamed protein product [Moneuplotes crassus]